MAQLRALRHVHMFAIGSLIFSGALMAACGGDNGGTGGGGGNGGSGGSGGTGGTGGGGGELDWQQANLTNFESYPDPDSDECKFFHGCDYVGEFAFVSGRQSEQWVMDHNIVAVHEKDADQYALKNLRLRMDGNEIDVTVYDECADSDCEGCCTQNSRETGFLIDIEKYTMVRFGNGDGIVDFACLDCDAGFKARRSAARGVRTGLTRAMKAGASRAAAATARAGVK